MSGHTSRQRQPEPSKEDLLAIAALTDELDREPVAKWPDMTPDDQGVIHMPILSYGPVMERVSEMAYEIGLVVPFDWSAWSDQARLLIEDPAKLAEADLPTCQRLMTFHLRTERFCEGHLAEMHETGHLAALLRRLGTLAIPTVQDR